jgi:hypothetical protein
MVSRLSSIAFWAVALCFLCFVTLSSADTPRHPHADHARKLAILRNAGGHVGETKTDISIPNNLYGLHYFFSIRTLKDIYSDVSKG